MKQLYQSSYFNDQYDQGLKIDSTEMKRRISQEDHRVKFFRKYKKGGRVIDIGCGRGYFLHTCRLFGYDVEGVDISDDAASYIINELKIPVKIGSVDKIDFENASIDVITMWHFLEHTTNPRDYLKKIRGWLKPDGLLVIDVPNYEGTDAQKTWAEWQGWQLPYHLYHFTPYTLESMLAKHGFKSISTKDYHSEYIKNTLKQIPVISLFSRLIAKRYSGTSFAVFGKKNTLKFEIFYEKSRLS
ncbi:MAG: class I SAM-dependent methyltransferase [Candidatus Desulfaltia sp.]|nr:class I SAM-dependent methyltransferase [Candidatus Desulfaltia sp.]